MNERVQASRLPALDVARGLAVLLMAWVHLVATEGGSTALERTAAAFGAAIYDLPAALFCVLVGVSSAIQVERGRGQPGSNVRLLRRAAALAVIGVVFGRAVWPTEILTPLACMIPLCVLACRGGIATLAGAALLVLVAMPLGRAWFGELAWTDWSADGTTHGAETAFGWITLRYYLYTGNYPLVGWLLFPLAGALAVRLGLLRDRALRHTVILVPLALIALATNAWLTAHAAEFDEPLAPHLAVSWVPTSIPFVVAGVLVSWAIVAIAVVTDVRWHLLAVLGRSSLSHYVLHVLVVFVPLRVVWPDEDWSITVGVAAFTGYLVVMLPVTVWWFRGHRRGPLEAVWARASGRARPGSPVIDR